MGNIQEISCFAPDILLKVSEDSQHVFDVEIAEALFAQKHHREAKTMLMQYLNDYITVQGDQETAKKIQRLITEFFSLVSSPETMTEDSNKLIIQELPHVLKSLKGNAEFQKFITDKKNHWIDSQVDSMKKDFQECVKGGGSKTSDKQFKAAYDALNKHDDCSNLKKQKVQELCDQIDQIALGTISPQDAGEIIPQFVYLGDKPAFDKHVSSIIKVARKCIADLLGDIYLPKSVEEDSVLKIEEKLFKGKNLGDISQICARLGHEQDFVNVMRFYFPSFRMNNILSHENIHELIETNLLSDLKARFNYVIQGEPRTAKNKLDTVSEIKVAYQNLGFSSEFDKLHTAFIKKLNEELGSVSFDRLPSILDQYNRLSYIPEPDYCKPIAAVNEFYNLVNEIDWVIQLFNQTCPNDKILKLKNEIQTAKDSLVKEKKVNLISIYKALHEYLTSNCSNPYLEQFNKDLIKSFQSNPILKLRLFKNENINLTYVGIGMESYLDSASIINIKLLPHLNSLISSLDNQKMINIKELNETKEQTSIRKLCQRIKDDISDETKQWIVGRGRLPETAIQLLEIFKNIENSKIGYSGKILDQIHLLFIERKIITKDGEFIPHKKSCFSFFCSRDKSSTKRYKEWYKWFKSTSEDVGRNQTHYKNVVKELEKSMYEAIPVHYRNLRS